MCGVEVVDYRDPQMGTVSVPLDPSLGPQANVQRCFKRYHALRAARQRIAERLERTRAAAAKAAELLEQLERAASLAELERVASRLPARAQQRAASARKGAPARGQELPAGIRAVALPCGCRVLVGRSARENDALSFKVARGNDTWLHVQDWPGPHVVVQPASRRQQVPERAVMDAAQLAVHFCRPARAAGRAEVLRTQVKHLRRGRHPGEVFVAGARTVLVRLDPARVDELLSREGEVP